ncbi:ATP-dependent RNA helicase DHX33 isoform X2 [Amblyraja radiata]|uniref:ATP-dependent RNA helicase DHX33 isoform X2 n=1 Tax=Amblyraja radiata TaxID=386614 RepID=UPI0014028AE6|nr:ATP-dependent RNA helicase DHX33 isoform X2 [Amblyraja radiata]
MGGAGCARQRQLRRALAGRMEARSPPAKRLKTAAWRSQGGNYATGRNMEQQRRELPIYRARAKLIGQLRHLDTAIIIGETGSGKTTQIPQYLYEACIGGHGVIAITQPRRVAAISLAARVSEEKKTELGTLIGYTVRFEDLTSHKSKIKFLTDGMLLREAMVDSLLCRYSVVILDEAHERTVQTDVLFGIVKSAQRKRKELNKTPLKVIIMSATMDVDLFSQYFNQAPVLYLEGRQHSIQIFYTKEPQNDYLHASLVSIFQIHQEAPPSHSVLVFLTGQEEIEAMSRTCKQISKNLPQGSCQMSVLPLYASLPPLQQLRVFQQGPKDRRKVILSTNIAETSVTIPGIKYVVDTGMVKAKRYTPESGLEVLAVQQVSKAQAWQRAGRAGRQNSGICYRLYTEDDFEKFLNMTVPEIQRCNLASVVLQLLALRIPDILTFDFISKPSPDAVRAAVDQLEQLGAVERKNNQIILTPLGIKMAAFPLEPRFSKEWCRENYVNSRNMTMVMEVRRQLRDICVKFGVHLKSSRADTSNVRRCLAHSLFLNAVELQLDGTYLTLDSRQPVVIHPSSVLFHSRPPYMLYNELLHTSKCYMRDLCVVDPEWLYEAAPEYFRRKLKGAKT